MKYNKLVRDKIPQIIKRNGDSCQTHQADDKEYWLKLKEKLKEEVKEFSKNSNEEELADVLEVIDAISEFKQFNKEKVRAIKKEKAIRNGTFKNKLILESTK